MEGLPEGCIANVIGLTTPIDACRLASVSTTFKSAAESDAAWERLLPSDYRSIISNSSDPSLLTGLSSKKELYLSLSNSPILIHHDKMSFQLVKETGKKIYMISARALNIAEGNNQAYWRWTSEPKSRFEEVGVLAENISWIQISGRISTSMLSSATSYAAYFVFKLAARSYGFDYDPVEVSTGIVGSNSCVTAAFLGVRTDGLRFTGRRRGIGFFNRALAYRAYALNASGNAQLARERGDGWLEVELGKFYNKEGGEELEMSVSEVASGFWKRGLIVQSIEIRPLESFKSCKLG